MRSNGFLGTIIADETYTVLAGHGRLKAAKELGLTVVPVLRFDHLTAAQKRAYVIADNKIAMNAGWDVDLLVLELGELADLLPQEGMTISHTGFEVAEVDLLLADHASPAESPDDVIPEPSSTTVARKGDVWILGRHRLLCGDSRLPTDMARLMDASPASAVFCDPPYNIRIRSVVGRGKTKHKEFAFASGEMSTPEFRDFLTCTLGHGVRHSKDGAVHYVCIDWRRVGDVIDVGKKLYGSMLNLAVWTKSNGGQGAFYRSQHELIAIFRVGDGKHVNNIELGRYGRNRSNVWAYAGVNTFGKARLESLKAHPTVKPVALVADAILDCTARGDIVLDQFMGSGTTILAAEKTGRIAYGLEWEPRYVDVAIARWERLTNLQATLEEDGRTFEEIRAAREAAGQTEEASNAQVQ